MKRSGCPHNHERGLALGIIILSSVMFSAAAVAVLNFAVSNSQHADQQEGRLQDRYAAEAALVWAMQKLWANPSECFAANPDFSLDPDGGGPLSAIKVDLITNPCPSPTASTTLKARVVP